MRARDRVVVPGELVTGSWLLCAPMRVEAAALARGAPRVALVRTGTGPRAARRAARSGRLGSGVAVAVAGIGGGLRPGLRTGDVVVADEVRTADGAIRVSCRSAPLLAAALRGRGLRVHVGAVVSATRPVGGRRRLVLARDGALAVDTESAWLLAGAGPDRACVRVVADTVPHAVFRPATLRRIARALPVLTAVAAALAEWGPATGLCEVRPNGSPGAAAAANGPGTAQRPATSKGETTR